MTTPLEPDGYVRIYFYEPVDIVGVGSCKDITFEFKNGLKHWQPNFCGFVHIVLEGTFYLFNHQNVRDIECKTNSKEFVVENQVSKFREQLDGGL